MERTMYVWANNKSTSRKVRGKNLGEICQKIRAAFPDLVFEQEPEPNRPGNFLSARSATGQLQVYVYNL